MAERKADGALADGHIDSVKQAGRLAFENWGGGRDVKWLCNHPEGSVRLSPGVLLCFPAGFGVGRLGLMPGALHEGLGAGGSGQHCCAKMICLLGVKRCK